MFLFPSLILQIWKLWVWISSPNLQSAPLSLSSATWDHLTRRLAVSPTCVRLKKKKKKKKKKAHRPRPHRPGPGLSPAPVSSISKPLCDGDFWHEIPVRPENSPPKALSEDNCSSSQQSLCFLRLDLLSLWVRLTERPVRNLKSHF